MNNPIKDNRLVVDMTFATRLLSFAQAITPLDACSYDEKNSMISYAKNLLTHQCLTATDLDEINYLKRVGNYNRFLKPILSTFENVKYYSYDDVIIYSCMKTPSVGDQVLQHNLKSWENNERKPNNNRIYFTKEENCLNYIREHKPSFSLNDLKKTIKLSRSGELISHGERGWRFKHEIEKIIELIDNAEY